MQKVVRMRIPASLRARDLDEHTDAEAAVDLVADRFAHLPAPRRPALPVAAPT